jgi:hypothetical protein
MGVLWTWLLPPPHDARTPPLTARDALALCEAGDLLLARESLEHRALRLRLALAVARDVGRVQRGRFPQQLVTVLPGACVMTATRALAPRANGRRGECVRSVDEVRSGRGCVSVARSH